MEINGFDNSLKIVKFKNLKVNENKKSDSPGFGEMLDNAWQKTNKAQLHAADMTDKLVTGQAENIHDVMIAAEKAKISMEFTMEVRNKIMSAYKEIMRMQI